MRSTKIGFFLPLKDSDYKQMRNFDLKIIRRQLATLNLQVNFIKELAFDLRYDLRKCLSFYFF